MPEKSRETIMVKQMETPSFRLGNHVTYRNNCGQVRIRPYYNNGFFKGPKGAYHLAPF